MEKSKNYLNLGCGQRYLKEWTNIDFISTSEGVIAHNLIHGIPFSDEAFDVVYHSHVLEHFTKDQAIFFIKECLRVLKPQGILRVVVPDLEEIVKQYTQCLKGSLAGEKCSQENYEWILLELFDQTVRNVSGGDMARYWRQIEIPNENYVRSRVGDEFTSFRKWVLGKEAPLDHKTSNNKWKRFFKLDNYRNKLLVWLYGDQDLFRLLELGKFRLSGEIHQWMYDRYSLGKLLTDVGFSQATKVSAGQSAIVNWNDFKWLDVENDEVRKPDSLFMEGYK